MTSPRGARRILLVDDNALSAQATAAALRLDGHEVRVAAHAAEALAGYIPGMADLLLTDLDLPDVNGWELVDRLRALDPTLRVGLITGLEEVSETEAGAHGVDLVLLKPVAPEELLARVAALA